MVRCCRGRGCLERERDGTASAEAAAAMATAEEVEAAAVERCCLARAGSADSEFRMAGPEGGEVG